MKVSEQPPVRVDRVLKDGRILFCRDGVYFALTRAQVSELDELVIRFEEKGKGK